MKQYAVFAAMTLGLMACSNDENVNPNDGPVEIRLSSGIEVQTRAYPTQNDQIASGETVYVWGDDVNGADATEYISAWTLTANGSGGFTGSPQYFPQTGDNINLYAMHGTFASAFASGSAFPTAEEGVTFSIAPDQSGMGTAYTNSDLLYAAKQNVARTTEEVQLDFYHMLSKIELAIVSGNGAPELATANAISIASVITDGTFKPGKSESDMATQANRAGMVETGSTTGTLTIGQTVCDDFTEANIVYNEAIVVPQDMGGKQLSFKLADGGELTYTIPSGTTFESGKVYRYKITMKLTGLEVTSSIAKWEPGNGDGSTGEAIM